MFTMTGSLSCTAVPDEFIDRRMADLGGDEVKLYLALLRLGGRGEGELSALCALTGLSAAQTNRALGVLAAQGLCTVQRDAQGELTAISLDSVRESPERAPQGPAAIAAEADASLSCLLAQAEQVLGHPLSIREMQTIAYIQSDLHFPEDLTAFLLNYCADLNKTDLRYVEKVALAWASQGIQSVKQAQTLLAKGPSGRGKGQSPARNPFNQFEQNPYDFDQLEKKLVDN